MGMVMTEVRSLEQEILDRFEVINVITMNYGDFDQPHMTEDWFPTTLATIRGHQGRLLYAYITPGKDYTVFVGEENQTNMDVARLEGRGIRAAIKKAGLLSTMSWTNSLMQPERNAKPLPKPCTILSGNFAANNKRD